MNEVIKILIADDDRHIRTAMAELLGSHGYHVIAVRDGQHAVKSYRKDPPDVVILDVMMPVMNGHEACREIRKIDALVPILFLTAFDEDADELEGLGLGADDFISKTASNEKILSRVEAAARRVRRFSTGNFVFGEGKVDALANLYIEEGREAVRLSEREVLLLREFVLHKGEVLSKDWLLTKIFGIDYVGDPRVIDKILERLRGKVGSSADTLVTIARQGVAYQHPVRKLLQ